MKAHERILKVIEYLNINKNTFSKEIGFANNSTINRLIAEERVPSRATLEKIVNRFPQINYDWLLTGEGEMIKETKTKNHPYNEAKPLTDIMFINVPLVPITARAGYLNGYGDMEFIETLPTFPVITDKEYKGKYMVFEVSGDSMDNGKADSILDGDKILCREVKRELWRDKLHFKKWYFLIVHKTEGIIVKQIINHDVKNCVITCHSLNSLYEDYNINLDDVLELYNVINVVFRNLKL